MNDFGIDFDPGNFGLDDFSSAGEQATGPYIPAIRDCASCGVCVQTCPTFLVRPEENYSPRGRVRLIDRVLNQGDELSDDEFVALNACTRCRACESVCPSRMSFYALLSQAMETLHRHPQQSLAIKLLLHPLADRRWAQRACDVLVQVYQRSGLHWVMDKLPVTPFRGDFGQLETLMPVPHRSHPVPAMSRPKDQTMRGKVALFTGCLANVFDTQTHQDTIKLLNRLGYEVQVLAGQTCCGAMHAHNGEIDKARELARTNLKVFANTEVDAVLFNSSGCGAFLADYPELLIGGADDGETTIEALTDVLSFLLEIDWPEDVTFAPLDTQVTVHEPCSQRNALKNQDAIYRLLGKIPGLEVSALADNAICCGAGGTQAITQPEFAAPLRRNKIDSLLASGAACLVSSNLSCSMHLAIGIREAGKDIAALHPVSLLARQLSTEQ